MTVAHARILVVTHYFPEHGGGVEIIADRIATGLVARGFDVEWLASREPATDHTRAPGARPVHAWNPSERLFGIPYPVWSPTALPTLLAALRRCDVLHLHDTLYLGNFAAFLGARRLRKPILVTQHVGHVPYRSRILSTTMEVANRVLAARVVRSAGMTVFYSRTTEQYFRRLVPAVLRSTWIANGLDTELFHPLAETARRELRQQLGWPTDRPVLLFVGRFVEKKGMRILASLTRRFPDVAWAFAGWGPDDPARWQGGNVIPMGKRSQPQLAAMYQAADLMVLPSVGEGFPLVVQESMACGTPVAVSTETAAAHPGLGEVVWAAEPAVDSFDALLRPLIAAPAVLHNRREVVAAMARREWSWDRCADQYAALLRSFVGTSPSA